MRAPLYYLRAVARAAGFSLAGVAMVATAIHLGRDEVAPQPVGMVVTPQTDPLLGELTRCEVLGPAAEQDAKCDAVWAENRRRFFTYRPADCGSCATQTRNQPASKPEGR
jgi:conjugative transfer region protein TrbK